MIRFHEVTKSFRSGPATRTIVSNLDLTVPDGRNLGILGRNGAGKSTLLAMIAGTMFPTCGRIERTGRVSWPLGFAGSFHPDLTGVQNTRFVARIYGVGSDTLVEYVEEFSELGQSFRLPVRHYSSGMRARLAFGVSMGIAFDTYLIDEITAVGDLAFKAKCRAALKSRTANANVIMVSHSLKTLREHCDCALLLEDSRATFFDNLEYGIVAHRALTEEPAAVVN